MENQIQSIYKKISYIEAEIAIQKQILHSIPTENREEIEKVLKSIISSKQSITTLRSEIKAIDPVEFEKLSRIEASVAVFKRMTSEKTFSSITSISHDEKCILSRRDGKEIDCLLKACDENGDWTFITIDGELITLTHDFVLNDT